MWKVGIRTFQDCDNVLPNTHGIVGYHIWGVGVQHVAVETGVWSMNESQ